MNNINIDVIIPVYNSEIYLKECLDSLLTQTYQEWNAICVDDGSTDSSYQILKEYSSKDKRIKILKKSNGGVSSARNEALKHIRNDSWIVFVDSDDYIHKNMFMDLNNLIGKVNDVECEYIRVFGIITNIRKNHNRNDDQSYSLMNREDYFLNAWVGGAVCTAVIKSSLIINNNLRFDQNMKIMEDQVFCYISAMLSKKIVVFNQKNYYWYTNPNSLTHDIKDNSSANIQCINHIYEFLTSTTYNEKLWKFFWVKYLPLKFSYYIDMKFNFFKANIRKGHFRINLNEMLQMNNNISLKENVMKEISFKSRVEYYFLKILSIFNS